MAQIIDPLRNGRLLIAVLLANFLAVPALAFVLTRILPMDVPAATALVLTIPASLALSTLLMVVAGEIGKRFVATDAT